MRAAFAAILGAVLLGACTVLPEDQRPAPLIPLDHALKIRAAWSHRLGDWLSPPMGRLAPVVMEGRLYLVDGHDRLRVFDAANGRPLWERPLGGRASSALGAGRGKLLLGMRDAEVWALDAGKGTVLWRQTVSSEVLVPPVAYQGSVLVRTGDEKVTVLSAEDGGRRWTYEQSVPALTLRGTSAPVAVDEAVYAGFANGKLAALDIRGGQIIWQVAIAAPRGRSELERMVDVDGDPLIVGPVLYTLAYQGRAVALSRTTGKVLWSRELSAVHGPVADDDLLYIADAGGVVWALDRLSGAPVWKQEGLRHRALSKPALFGDYLVVADFAGYLHWLSRRDGTVRGRYRMDDAGVVAALTPVGERLYVVGASGVIEALKPPQP
ncbi:MAG TPA: outer membrane protein assembly factor BamB [Gammaproteobacteria bacterium]|nr:outer membrane protein assembly factor BamB [Gammaproteobacteria bacterium]